VSSSGSLAVRWALICVPLLFGLLSVLRGQDANWDLYNYHLYNAYALLRGKLDIDLAPAGAQSYFNPALDVAYYLLITRAWPPAAALLLGALHGLHFVLLYAMARKVLERLPDSDQQRVPLLLAAAGCLTANFLAGLGNTMGDNTTSVFQLAGLLLLVSRAHSLQSWSPALAGALIAAGAASGLGVGLKLTNAVYALAMCLALLFVGGAPASRLRNAFVFGGGALLGFALTGGYWLVELWERFGNPLFPQFGNLFAHPLTQEIGALDSRWLPRGVLEIAFWPFILSLNPGRVSELRVYQLGWIFWYVLMLAWLAMHWRPAWRARLQGAAEPGARLVVAFVALGFVIWAGVFSIYRYIVPIEALLPLVLWILAGQIFPYVRAKTYAKRVIVLCTAGVLLLGLRTWGHVDWTDPPWRIDAPETLDADRDTVIVAEQPLAWLGIGFPPQVAFASVLSSFPESPRYAERLRQIVDARGGRAHLMLAEKRNTRADTVGRINRKLEAWGILASLRGCDALGWLLANTRLRASLRSTPASAGASARCELALRPGDEMDLPAENAAHLLDITQRIERYRLLPEPDTCRSYSAYYGDRYRPFRLCRVRSTGAG
jgi:hypothetical protein